MRASAFGAFFSSLALLALQTSPGHADLSWSCSNTSVSLNGELTARCRTSTNVWLQASINLNERIANLDGRLSVIGTYGLFAASCRGISINNSHVMQASCRELNGQYQDTSIDLDQYIVNREGYLMWDIAGLNKPRISCGSPPKRDCWLYLRDRKEERESVLQNGHYYYFYYYYHYYY